jgi:hypothetical protein
MLTRSCPCAADGAGRAVGRSAAGVGAFWGCLFGRCLFDVGGWGLTSCVFYGYNAGVKGIHPRVAASKYGLGWVWSSQDRLLRN